MGSTKSERLESNTGSTTVESETVQHTDEVVPLSVPTGGTASPPPQKARTVPSSVAVGSVWLRYTARQKEMGSCESSTGT